MHVLDREEALSVILVGVLERDIDHDALRTELDVEDASVFEGQEAGLLGHPEGDIGCLEVKAVDAEADGRVVLGCVCNQ